MPSLDDVEALRKADRQGMLETYLRWPEALLSGARRAEELEIPAEVRIRGSSIRYGQPSSVVIVGRGSAAGGDLLVDLTWARTPVPILVWRDYRLPAFVGPSTPPDVMATTMLLLARASEKATSVSSVLPE